MLDQQSNQQFQMEIQGISLAVEAAKYEIQNAAISIGEAYTAPHILMKPTLKPDGDMWCALYGSDLMEGVAGFGKTPAEAMKEFDKAWQNGPTPKALAAREQQAGAKGGE